MRYPNKKSHTVPQQKGTQLGNFVLVVAWGVAIEAPENSAEPRLDELKVDNRLLLGPSFKSGTYLPERLGRSILDDHPN